MLLNYFSICDYRTVIPFSPFPSSLLTLPYTTPGSLPNMSTNNIRNYTNVLYKIHFNHILPLFQILPYPPFLSAYKMQRSKQTDNNNNKTP